MRRSAWSCPADRHGGTGDGYGERADGAPFTSETGGIGRAWPLLIGERAHFEIAAGRIDEARRLSGAIERFSCPEGMLPKQLWDADDVPDPDLFFGRPTGSSVPLVWAHAGYVKLLRLLRDGAVFDMPPHTKGR